MQPGLYPRSVKDVELWAGDFLCVLCPSSASSAVKSFLFPEHSAVIIVVLAVPQPALRD
jgi:hypothetical protein